MNEFEAANPGVTGIVPVLVDVTDGEKKLEEAR